MTLAFLLAVQAGAAIQGPPALAAIDFDLARLQSPHDPLGRRARACVPAEGEEIVVCGYRARDGDYPFAEMGRRYETGPLRAETSLGGNLTGRVFVDSVTMPNGMVSNRVMVGIRLPF